MKEDVLYGGSSVILVKFWLCKARTLLHIEIYILRFPIWLNGRI